MEIVSSINAIELLALKDFPEVFNNKTKSRVSIGCNDVTCV